MSFFRKVAPIISVLLLIIFLIALLFYPDTSQLVSTMLIVFGLGTTILFTIQGNWETKQNDEPFDFAQDRLTNAQFARNATVDLLGLVLTLFIAMWLGRMAGGYAAETWGMFVGIVAAMAVGFIAAFFVGKLWGKFAEPMKVKAA